MDRKRMDPTTEQRIMTDVSPPRRPRTAAMHGLAVDLRLRHDDGPRERVGQPLRDQIASASFGIGAGLVREGPAHRARRPGRSRTGTRATAPAGSRAGSRAPAHPRISETSGACGMPQLTVSWECATAERRFRAEGDRRVQPRREAAVAPRALAATRALGPPDVSAPLDATGEPDPQPGAWGGRAWPARARRRASSRLGMSSAWPEAHELLGLRIFSASTALLSARSRRRRLCYRRGRCLVDVKRLREGWAASGGTRGAGRSGSPEPFVASAPGAE